MLGKEIKDVKDGEYPFYDKEEKKTKVEYNPSQLPTHSADTVGGFTAVSYAAAGPNKLVATNSSGKLPNSTVQGAVIPPYGSNALALAGGLTVGQFYRNTDGVSIVH